MTNSIETPSRFACRSAARGSRRNPPSVGGTRRGFTLVELLLAGLIVALIVGAVGFSLAQVGRARGTARVRLDAYLRADAALDTVRRDVQSLIRSDDLYLARVLLFDDTALTPAGSVERDELLIFSTRLQAVRPIEYNGEGGEYESQFRVFDDDMGPGLWQRRDPVPDEFPGSGGVASPVADGLLSLRIEAYDGDSWYDEWDSDVSGLPWAVRITVVASGAPIGSDAYAEEYPWVTLRTVVPIDRVPPPPPIEEEELEADLDGDGETTEQEAAAASAAAAAGVQLPQVISIPGGGAEGASLGGAGGAGKGGGGGPLGGGGGGSGGGPGGGKPKGGGNRGAAPLSSGMRR